ncbi:hypothetical protein GUJ93_ZPchr0004g39719 [Zizania palustris]|uniref:Protein kinase domain-containing protein n=1 Tax=Zizania palustris TaxID=103762 RepID=A0A8J5VEW5_ZIZPA|nr:hypothetical protein GUJ93_ZPchr0004g39719 [Zizania palustris]
MLSDSNKLTVIGCRTLAYIADENDVGNYMSGCLSTCRRGEFKSATKGICNGIGCCQTKPIPRGLDYYRTWFDVNTMNTSSEIYNRTPCSYAVLMESSNFTFSTTYLTPPTDFNTSYGGQAPMVLDWAIKTYNSCDEAKTAAACERNCGGVEIPYPFGLDPDCSLPGFNLSCNTSGDGKPYHNDVEVLSISVLQAQARMRMDISSACYNETSRGMISSGWSLNLRDTPYRYSNSGNRFTAIGCKTLAYIAVDSSPDDRGGSLTTGCVATCGQDGVTGLTNGSCSGIGCCQTAIPNGFQSYEIWFDDNFNTSSIYNISRCSYAALVEESSFTFSANYATSSAFNDYYGGQAPLVVDWSIGNKTCNEAQKMPDDYACVSSYSECFNSSNGPGYFCNCSQGFHGNPYLKPEDPGSCKVIRNKRNIKKQALLRQNDEFFQQNGGELLLQMMRAQGNVGFTIYDRDEIEAATDNFSKMNIIGEGGQGTVYRAVLDGVVVAIKMCKEIDESRRKDFVQELVILCRVSHPNVVKLLGCCLQFEAPMLVYEFVRNKTLQELLDLQRSRRFHATLGTRLRIAAESAFALAHIHSLPHPILHGDIKPANILLAEGLVAKVSDFGCSTIDEKAQAVPKGTLGYLDPDYLLEYQLTAKNDVYSFGVILLELLTGKRPLSKERKSLTSIFQEAMADGTLIEILDCDIVNEASMGVIHQAAVLASQCLIVPGSTRPTMGQVAEELRRLAEADELQQYPQQPLIIESHNFMEMEIGNTCTTSSWYAGSNTTGVYSLGNKVVQSTEFAR